MKWRATRATKRPKNTILAGFFLGVHYPKATEPIVDLFSFVWYYTFPFEVLHCPLHNPTSPNVLELSNSEVCSLNFVPEDVSFLLSLNHQTKFLHVGLYQAPTGRVKCGLV
jgi:hypothetical protein